MAVGLGLSFVGYWLAYFGYCSIKGPGVGLIDLIVPGRTITIPGGNTNPTTPQGLPPGSTLPPTTPGGPSSTVNPQAPLGSPQNPYNLGTIG